MNCWDLLQCYLSKNIFNNPSATSLSSNTSLVSSTSSKKKGHTKTKTPKRRNGALRNIQVVHSRRKSSNASFSEPTVKKKVTAGQPQVEKVNKCNQFSPRSPLSIKLGGGRVRKQGLSSSQRRAKLQQLLQPKSGGTGKMRSPGHSAILLPPSIVSSPILSSCDDMSSSQSDCSVSVDDTFRLYLDSDEESNTSVENPLAGGMSHSPKLQALTHSSQQRHVNGYRLQHIHNVKSRLPSGHSRKGKILVKKNGLSRRNLPSSTTHNDSTDDSTESWSKNRLRKRVRSSSPSPSLESAILDCSSGGHAEVSSTTSPPPNPPPPPPAITTGPLVPVRQSPSPEYQQELLEWQFMLNKQCRPAEAFILVENRIDEASIPWGFKYITSNIYGEGVPDPGRSEIVSRICGCTCYIMGKRCGPKNEHCCPQMAGAEFPYSPAGKVKLPAGNPIYECNSRCSCPQDCTNRVVQRGRKINMSIFRTSNGRGWGVKTMEPIKPNTFVTEYVGEVVTTEEAERRGQLYDQEGRTYLFDLDFDCDDNAFTIDAAHYGNISHFFNHSVSTCIFMYMYIQLMAS